MKSGTLFCYDRDSKLRTLLDKFRSSDGSYDVIVPCSGGKDGGYVAHILKYKYNMNPLTVTWSPHLYTEIGWQNFQGMIHTGDIANVLGTPAGKTHRKLTKISFEILGDPFQPFILGQKNLAPRYLKVRNAAGNLNTAIFNNILGINKRHITL